ncbi:hypothetical protein Vretimale_7204 [Volvox reticuliferus]|nr:hypothetical protein Vretimale_7204 [Volvox reticuliferus]
MEGPGGDPQRVPDLMALAGEILSRWPLAAAVLTGDLTEAKDVYGRGQQYEQEWQMYRDAWNALSSLGNVPYDQIYDIRGNHDTFNSGPRCGPQDHYCTYSVRAARVNQMVNGTSTADGGQGGPRDRIFIDAVYGRTDDGRGSSNGSGSCPLAVLVGVDASLDPGMRSPTNFFGVVAPTLLDELDEQLAASLASMHAAGCSPPYIAYGHYPLSTIAYPGRRRTGASEAAAAASVQQILVRHGVSAYLAGHLHGAFGHKLHRLHKAPIATNGRPMGHMLELEMVDWKHARTVRLLTLDLEAGGAVSFADFRYIPPQRLSSLLSSTVRQEADLDGTADLGARPDGRAVIRQPFEPFEATCAVGAYLPLITCPPDARYSPQLTAAPYSYDSGCRSSASVAASGGNIAATAVVRVMLLPVSDAVPAVPTDTVYLHWSCDVSGEVPESKGDGGGGDGGGRRSSSSSSNRGATIGGTRSRLSGVMDMQLEFAGANYSTYTVDLLRLVDGAPVTVARSANPAGGSDSVRRCPPGCVIVQVRVAGSAGHDKNSSDAGAGSVESFSAERPLHWDLAEAHATGPHDAFWPTMDGAGGSDRLSSVHYPPPRLQQTVLEWLVMHVPWHSFGLVTAAAQWCVLTLGMLVAPRVFVVLKAIRAQNHGPARHPTSSTRQGRWRLKRHRQRRRNGLPSELGGCGSDEAEEGDAELRDPVETAGAAVAVARRQLDWMGEGASTSVCLGGMCGSKTDRSPALKRSSSISSTGGGAIGTQATHPVCGGDTPSTPTGLEAAPLNSDSRAGGANKSGGEATWLRGARGTAVRFWRTGWKVVRCWLLWPLRDLIELADHRDYVPWLTLALYGIYLAVGPWFAAEFIAPSDSSTAKQALSGYGFLAAYGIYVRSIPMIPGDAAQRPGRKTGWSAAPSEDHVAIVNVVALTCIAPALLLCVSAAARLRRMAVAGKLDIRSGCMSIWQILSWRQTAALCGIAVLNVGLCWKLWAGLGWMVVAVSPGVGWLLPLLLAWLWMTSSRAAILAQQSMQTTSQIPTPES